jgi:hypothetical protein
MGPAPEEPVAGRGSSGVRQTRSGGRIDDGRRGCDGAPDQQEGRHQSRMRFHDLMFTAVLGTDYPAGMNDVRFMVKE